MLDQLAIVALLLLLLLVPMLALARVTMLGRCRRHNSVSVICANAFAREVVPEPPTYDSWRFSRHPPRTYVGDEVIKKQCVSFWFM